MNTEELDQDLLDRGISLMDQALVFSTSAFTNTGFTIERRDSLYLEENASTFTTLVSLVLIGNTFAPLGRDENSNHP